MAACNISLWTVVVLVEENPSLTREFQMSPDTKLCELVQAWKGECGVFGNWIFKSADERTTYNDYWMSLEIIGETVPHSRIINLKAESIDEPASLLFREIFVNLNKRCHRLFVTPDETVGEVMWRVPGSPEYLEFNGEPLNLKHTVEQAGLQDKSVLYQRLCSVTVKLSSGYSRVFQVPLDSLVWHLIERVNVFETEEFSLKYEGRYLKPDEAVRHLTKTVEVRRAEFIVNVDGRRISWRTKEEAISVSDFLPQLMLKGEMDAKILEELEFVCVGCQRRLRNSQDDIQFLPVECCGERSMTLDALVPSETRPNSDRNDLTEHIQILQELLERCRLQDSCVEGSRCVCRDLKQKFAAEGLDYNVLTQNSQTLLRRISDLEDKLQKLNVVVETSEKEIGRLQTENLKIKEEKRDLVDKNKKLLQENKDLVVKNKKLLQENKDLVVKNKELDKENKDLVVKNKNLDKENKDLVVKNKNLDKENKDLVVKNKKLLQENRDLVVKNKELDKENRDLVVKNKNLDKENRDLVVKNKNLDKENKDLVDKNKELDKENKDLVVKNKNLDKENKDLVDKNKELDKENKDLVDKNKNLDKENKDLVVKNKNLDKENKDLVSQGKDPQGATAVGPPHVPATPTEQLGVKLIVLYISGDFSPVAGRPELQFQGSGFIKCLVGKLRPGWAAFKEVRDALRPLFKRPRIARICQWRGLVDGRPVAWVTSPDDEVTGEFFCSSDGHESRRGEVKEGQWQDIREGGRVFIAGGQRRTVLRIFKS